MSTEPKQILIKRKSMKEFVTNNKDFIIVILSLLSVIAASISVFISSKSFRNTNRALGFTQKQMAESKRQFELSNNPLLQVELDMDNVGYTNEWPNEIRYSIKNLGKYPIRIKSGSVGLRSSNVPLDSVGMMNYISGMPNIYGYVLVDKTKASSIKTGADNQNILMHMEI